MPRYYFNNMPKLAKVPTGEWELVWTNHAKKEAMLEPHGAIKMWSKVDLSKGKLIEIDTDGAGKVESYLYQFAYGFNLILKLKLIFRGGKAVVKTTWLNHITDNQYDEHNPMVDLKRYSVPQIAYFFNHETSAFELRKKEESSV